MSLNARFVADFSSFTDAVNKAEAQLVDFSKGAGTVEQSLSRMTDSFSGQKIIQQAILMARAVEDAGGISTLTAKQLETLGAQADEAAAKMQKLGIGVPANLQAISDASKQTGTSLSGLQNVARDLLATFGLVFSIGAIVQWGKALVDSTVTAAEALVDMHGKTGISIEGLQRFALVAQQSGATLEDFSQSAFKLGANISGGSTKVREAIRELGLSFENLRGLNPEDQFNAIAKALEGIAEPQERNRIGIELFGKSFATIAPAIAKGYTDMAAQATVSSAAQVQAIDETAKAWDRWVARQKTAITSALGNMVLWHDAMEKVSAEQKGFLIDTVGPDKFEAALIRLAGASDLVLPSMKKTADVTTDYRAALAAATIELNAMTPAQRANIDAALKLGESHVQIATNVHLSEQALALYIERQRGVTEQSKAFKGAVDNLLPVLTDPAWDGSVTSMLRLGGAVHDTAIYFGQSEGVVRAASTALKAHDEELKQVAESYKKLTAGLGSDGLSATLHELGQQLTILVPTLTQVTNLLAYAHDNAQTANALMRQLNSTIGLMPDTADAAAQHMSKLLSTTEHWTTDLDHLSSTLALLGRVSGGTFGAMATDASQAVRAVSDVARSVSDLSDAGSNLSKGLATGDLVASAVAAGAAIFDIFKNIGGPSQDELDARKSFDSLRMSGESLNQTIQRISDSLIATGISGPQALAMVQAALDATHVSAQAEDDAIKAINDTLGASAQDTADLQAAIDRYGFSINELGPAMQKQKLDEQAQQILNDWRLLVGSGIDLATVNDHMAATMNDYLKVARQTGQEVPAAMEPILQKMIDQGELTDDAGNKITDLKDIGVTFAESMTKGFDRVVEKLNELLKGLGLIPAALDAIPDSKTITIDTVYTSSSDPNSGITNPYQTDNPYGSTGGMVTASGIQHFMGGGTVLPFTPRGSDTVPAMLTPGETVDSVADTKSTAASLRAMAAAQKDTASTLASMKKLVAGLDRSIAVAVSDSILLMPKKTA